MSFKLQVSSSKLGGVFGFLILLLILISLCRSREGLGLRRRYRLRPILLWTLNPFPG